MLSYESDLICFLMFTSANLNCLSVYIIYINIMLFNLRNQISFFTENISFKSNLKLFDTVILRPFNISLRKQHNMVNLSADPN